MDIWPYGPLDFFKGHGLGPNREPHEYSGNVLGIQGARWVSFHHFSASSLVRGPQSIPLIIIISPRVAEFRNRYVPKP